MRRGGQYVGDQMVERRGVAFDIRGKVETLAAAHDGDAVIAERAAHEDLVAWFALRAAEVHARCQHTDTARVDVNAVAVAAIHHLGVTRHELDARLLRCICH